MIDYDADKIISLRLKRGFTVKTISEKLELHSDIIYSLEKGKYINPSSNLILRLCREYKCTPYNMMKPERVREYLMPTLTRLINNNSISSDAIAQVLLHCGI